MEVYKKWNPIGEDGEKFFQTEQFFVIFWKLSQQIRAYAENLTKFLKIKILKSYRQRRRKKFSKSEKKVSFFSRLAGKNGVWTWKGCFLILLLHFLSQIFDKKCAQTIPKMHFSTSTWLFRCQKHSPPTYPGGL